MLPSRREVFLFFHPAQKPLKPQSRMIPAPEARSISPPLFRTSPPRASSALSPPMVTGLGLSLFGCAPENLASLTPEQRAHCSGALHEASLAAAFPGQSHEIALDAGRWAQAIRDRNTPLAVPCTSLTKTAGKGIGQTANTLMLDPICALRHLAGETQ